MRCSSVSLLRSSRAFCAVICSGGSAGSDFVCSWNCARKGCSGPSGGSGCSGAWLRGKLPPLMYFFVSKNPLVPHVQRRCALTFSFCFFPLRPFFPTPRSVAVRETYDTVMPPFPVLTAEPRLPAAACCCGEYEKLPVGVRCRGDGAGESRGDISGVAPPGVPNPPVCAIPGRGDLPGVLRVAPGEAPSVSTGSTWYLGWGCGSCAGAKDGLGMGRASSMVPILGAPRRTS
mmetsp:Transcript_751/g.1888  ORF Transcript_751/g.1888 Transcript_751/m.1888 type:complete len:231 (+) Transcript_751:1457-2149(+)